MVNITETIGKHKSREQ